MMVKAETGKSLQSTSTAQDAEINQIIFDTQQWLSSEYDWPFLKGRWDVAIPVGGRYASFPTTDTEGTQQTVAINFERAGQLKVYIKWNNIWQEVNYGIREMAEFNYIDSDRGQVLDPIQRWQFADENQFEVWPLPATATTLRFVGQRVVAELRSNIAVPPTWDDSAVVNLDDLMVAYYASAEYALREQQSDLAKLLLQSAQTRMAQVRATYPLIERPATIVGGGSTLDRRALRIVPMVVVSGR